MIEPLSLETMILRLVAAIVLGAIIGSEREFAGKEAGIRTDIMVAGGAAIFSIIGIMLPHVISQDAENLRMVLASNSGFLTAIGNIVIGVGFLGAGIIVKQGTHVHGLTTAATVWYVAAIGVLCGIGLLSFAAVAAVGGTLILLGLRKMNLYGLIGRDEGIEIEQDKN